MPRHHGDFDRLAARLLAAVVLALAEQVTAAHAPWDNRTADYHSCTHGQYGLEWQSAHRHAASTSITATEPRAAQIYRGTIRRLAHSHVWLIALSTWGQARQTIGDVHPYVLVYWPRTRPTWLILVNSPALKAGATVKVPCQR